MPYIPHSPVKPEKLVNQYIGLLERRVIVPQLFNRVGIDDFKGGAGDAVSIKVPGRLPARRYAFRNDRTNPIKLDVYSERKVVTTFGDLIYSASPVTDEQKDFDGVSPTSLLVPQSTAVAKEIENICITKVLEAPYQVLIAGLGLHPTGLQKGLLHARSVFNQLRQPEGGRFMLVGSEFETALLENDKLNLASNVGDEIANSTFRAATLGTRYGITFVRSDEIGTNDAYLMNTSAFNLLSGAPSVPEGATFGATTTFNGYALRWLKDYDFMYRHDRSSVDTYIGVSHTEDVFLKWDNTRIDGANSTAKGEVVGTEDHFVRAIKLSLTGVSSAPLHTSVFGLDTGVHTRSVKRFLADGTTPLIDVSTT